MWGFDHLIELFWFLKGRCHGNQLNSKNRRFSCTNLPCWAAIRKRIAISQFHFKRFNRMNFSTLCTILVAFGSETLVFTPFALIRQKSAYHAKYLRMSWTSLDLLYRFSRRISGDDCPNICLAVAQGMLLWQLVKYGRCSQTLRRMTFTLWPIVNTLSKGSVAIIRLHHVQI